MPHSFVSDWIVDRTGYVLFMIESYEVYGEMVWIDRSRIWRSVGSWELMLSHWFCYQYWNVIPCRLESGYRHIRGASCLHLQGSPGWRQESCPKYWHPPTNLHIMSLVFLKSFPAFSFSYTFILMCLVIVAFLMLSFVFLVLGEINPLVLFVLQDTFF